MKEEPIKREDWINARNMHQAAPKPRQAPQIDPEVSKIVGHPVAVNDPRLIREVIKWQQYSSEGKFDKHLQDPKKREDLKKIFGEKKTF